MRSAIALLSATILVASSASVGRAQHDGRSHRLHADPTSAREAPGPTETGEAAFAAVAEIVAILSSDPETEWSRVDIDALRAHLVDMSELMLRAEVETTEEPNGLRMRVSLDGRAGEAALRMVPAHGPVLSAETGWSTDVAFDDDAFVWTVEDPTGADVSRIRALGFFGLMATGDHHRPHHIAIARGERGH